MLATALGVLGSLVQARYISPDDLGYLRKYSVISGYAIFLNLGLFTLLQKELPLLIARGETEKAHKLVSIVQSWCLLMSIIICGTLGVFSFLSVFQERYRESAALLVQIISVWSTLYVGFLSTTFRSGQEFQRLAKGNFLSAFVNTLLLPIFQIWPFFGLIIRSITGQIVATFYLHLVRPVKVGWTWPGREFLSLVKRGIRIYIGIYLRYSFWITVETWLMLLIAKDIGVGLLVFSKMIAEATNQILSAIIQVYLPRIAGKFGETNDIKSCLLYSIKPSLMSLVLSLIFIITGNIFIPPIISIVFPRYVESIPLIRIFLLQSILVSFSIPIYMVTVIEDYKTQIISSIVGLIIFTLIAIILKNNGFGKTAVAWGSLGGQTSYVAISIFTLLQKAKYYRNRE